MQVVELKEQQPSLKSKEERDRNWHHVNGLEGQESEHPTTQPPEPPPHEALAITWPHE